MIRYANESDLEFLKKYEHGISETELRNSIRADRILVLFHQDCLIGWLRFNLFWDNTPFMNMLYLGSGNGKK